MSTKIYDGYRLEPAISDTGLALQAWWRAVRPRIERKREQLATAMLVREMFRVMDCHTLGTMTLKESAYWTVSKQAKERVKTIRASRQRDPEVDFDFEVCVIPSGDGLGELAILFTEQEELRRLFGRLPGVSYYGYWHNTDRPRGMSAKDWKKRGAAWNAAMPDGVPGRHGFTLTASDTLYLMMPRAHRRVPRMAAKWDRAYKHAFNAVLSARVGCANIDVKRDGFSAFMDLDRDVRDNGATAVAELADSLAMRLPERYSWDELLKQPTTEGRKS